MPSMLCSWFTVLLLIPSLCFASSSADLEIPPRSNAERALPSWSQRNLKTIQRIYNLTVYPNNVPIVQKGASAVPTGLFNKQATGRVSPVGNFSGFDDSIEYFFALAPVPSAQNNNLLFYEADVVAYTSGCPSIASSLVYLRTGSYDNATGKVDPTKPKSTLSQVAFWRFDDSGAVLDYQAWIPTLQRWSEVVTGVDLSNQIVQSAVATQICPVIQQRCTGSNQQYLSVLDCITELELKPFGTFDEAWGDNVVCRIIHLMLTLVRPEVHCPHVGPKGGSAPNNYKCVNIDYSISYFDDAQLFGSDRAFQCV